MTNVYSLFVTPGSPVAEVTAPEEAPPAASSGAPTPAQGPCWVIRHDAVIVVQAKHFTYAIDTGGDNRWWYSELERPNERHLVTWPEVLAWLNAEAAVVNSDVSAGRPFTLVAAR